MKPRIDIEKIGVVSLWVLLAVWVIFLVKYALGLPLPEIVNTALIVVGVAAGIGVFAWLARHARLL
jgi:hypothetical protein